MASALKKLAVCLFYGCSSASLSLINKGVFHVHNYKFPNMVLLIQFIYGVFFTLSFKLFKPEGIPKIWKVPVLSFENAKNCSILSITFLGNVMAGITAISKVNIPVFLAFRRLTTAVIFITDVLFLKKKPNAYETIGVICISLGAILAGLNDLKADVFGYFLIFVNNVMTTVHFNMIKKLSEKHPNIDGATSSFYMSTLSIPLLFLLVQLEEPAAFHLFNKEAGFYFLMLLSLNAGITLTFSQNWCTVITSPIVTSITGNVKDVFLTFISLFVFDDVVPNFWLIVGLCISLGGAFIYSYPNIQQLQDKKA